MKEHYLDNAATTKPCEAAVHAMLRCFQETYGNPSSLHRVGLRAQQEMDSARKILAAALGCDVREILFTSCATESTNTALRSIAAAYGRRRRKIVTSAVEHASVRQTLGFLSENEGFEIVEIAPDENGMYHARDFIQAVDENTCLITMMMVNNETGYVLPVKEVFSAVKRRFPQIITHCDAVQGFMKYPVRPTQLQADFISLSGHKVHAAKGVGALYVKRGMKLRPLLLGGKQENSQNHGREF